MTIWVQSHPLQPSSARILIVPRGKSPQERGSAENVAENCSLLPPQRLGRDNIARHATTATPIGRRPDVFESGSPQAVLGAAESEMFAPTTARSKEERQPPHSRASLTVQTGLMWRVHWLLPLSSVLSESTTTSVSGKCTFQLWRFRIRRTVRNTGTWRAYRSWIVRI